MKKVELEEMRQMIVQARNEIDALKKKLSDIERKLNKKK